MSYPDQPKGRNYGEQLRQFMEGLFGGRRGQRQEDASAQQVQPGLSELFQDAMPARTIQIVFNDPPPAPLVILGHANAEYVDALHAAQTLWAGHANVVSRLPEASPGGTAEELMGGIGAEGIATHVYSEFLAVQMLAYAQAQIDTIQDLSFPAHIAEAVKGGELPGMQAGLDEIIAQSASEFPTYYLLQQLVADRLHAPDVLNQTLTQAIQEENWFHTLALLSVATTTADHFGEDREANPVIPVARNAYNEARAVILDYVDRYTRYFLADASGRNMQIAFIDEHLAQDPFFQGALLIPMLARLGERGFARFVIDDFVQDERFLPVLSRETVRTAYEATHPSDAGLGAYHYDATVIAQHGELAQENSPEAHGAFLDASSAIYTYLTSGKARRLSNQGEPTINLVADNGLTYTIARSGDLLTVQVHSGEETVLALQVDPAIRAVYGIPAEQKEEMQHLVESTLGYCADHIPDVVRSIQPLTARYDARKQAEQQAAFSSSKTDIATTTKPITQSRADRLLEYQPAQWTINVPQQMIPDGPSRAAFDSAIAKITTQLSRDVSLEDMQIKGITLTRMSNGNYTIGIGPNDILIAIQGNVVTVLSFGRRQKS